ncbi:MAG: hypothetical protein HYT70_04155 [Candidatus Aenigmarchaeota archaeon]|nr:hypothetical protein [Candidatus Aenigmarchaeota archaeon]
MGIKTVGRKIKLARIKRIRNAPRWADIRKFGMKRARTRRIQITKVKRWRRTRVKI